MLDCHFPMLDAYYRRHYLAPGFPAAAVAAASGGADAAITEQAPGPLAYCIDVLIYFVLVG